MLMKNYSQVNRMVSYVAYLMFFITCTILSRQFPLNEFSGVMNFSLIIFLFLSFYLARIEYLSCNIIVFLITIFFLILLAYYSLISGNEPNLILRFFIILLSIVIAYHIKPDLNYVNIAVFCFFIQAIVVIVLQILLLFYFSQDYATSIRNIFISNGWGDVYNYGYGLWNIQLKGNALLPFFFFISFIFLNGRLKYFLCSSFLIASVFSGNFAFVLGFITFFILYALINLKLSAKRFYFITAISITFIFLSFNFIYNYILRLVSQKAGYSSQHRIEQSLALIGDLAESNITLFFGGGLGSTNISGFGYTFNNNLYFELQTLYIINQMGLFLFSIFVFFNVFFVLKYIKYKELIVVYISYFVYSFWNPYIFDTNHVVVIVILVSLAGRLNKKSLEVVIVRCRYRAF